MNPENATRHVLIGGPISQRNLQARLAKLRACSWSLRYLVLKIGYMGDLLERGYMLGDLLFKLCLFKCFFLGSEPVFLPEQLQIKIEVQTFQDGFVYRHVPFLALLPRVSLAFDLGSLEFPVDTVDHPVQAACFFIDRVVVGRETAHFDFLPVKNPLNNFEPNKRDARWAEPLARERVLELLDLHYVKNENRRGPTTFANLILFCKMAALEFRNLNHISLLDYQERLRGKVLLDLSRKKPELFRTVLQVCVRNTNQAVTAVRTQERDFQRLGTGNAHQKYVCQKRPRKR